MLFPDLGLGGVKTVVSDDESGEKKKERPRWAE